MRCDDGARSGDRPTVLLIPGTGGTPDEVWSWNYERALPAAGYGWCTVTLPGRAMGDFSTSAEYAAYAALEAHRVSGRPIAIVGHSQGGAMAAWIAKFWPEVSAVTAAVIPIAAPLSGTALADSLCAGGMCSPIAWQMGTHSHVERAFANAPVPAGIAFTSIQSLQDELVFPQPGAGSMRGGRTVMVQDVCPGHLADHGTLLFDAVAYGLVLDALGHEGSVDPDRVDRSVCSQAVLPGSDPASAVELSATLTTLTPGLLDPGNWVPAEHPLPAYAVPYDD
ncbi:alpha/beta fold hydrolase [Nocardia sp. NPDC004860]|uniref:esterase/lipase family protein n=1 Tax=Nocardia sp. NPDC004860 TaxID=3154557 RepID=UPI0033ACEB11